MRIKHFDPIPEHWSVEVTNRKLVHAKPWSLALNDETLEGVEEQLYRTEDWSDAVDGVHLVVKFLSLGAAEKFVENCNNILMKG